MSFKIRKNTNPKQVVRFQVKKRIKRKFVDHQSTVPRLVPFRSNRFLYCQLVDPMTGKTIAQANSREVSLKELKSHKGVEAASAVGKLLAERAKAANIEQIVFDRNGYSFHGRVKAIADGAREAGLKF